MNILEAAKSFAIMAHNGQFRRCEPDKPVIVHPIGVANKLIKYGFDDHVVAAGYLHDVIEDTSYTIDDIKKVFGIDVAQLVYTATEPNPNDSWEKRKSHTINSIKDLPLRNKAVICADKIDNLESLKILFTKNGHKDFSAFKRGEELQKWYYTEVYKSLIIGCNPELPIFRELKDMIDYVFYDKENNYLKETIFIDNSDYYGKLKKLDAQIEELKQLKMMSKLSKPFIVEFTGTPRTGKTTSINALYDFFKKGGFKISVIEEFTSSSYYKDILKNKIKELSVEERNLIILENIHRLLATIDSNSEIVLLDRSLNDRMIWNYYNYKRGSMSEETYYKTLKEYEPLISSLIDYLIITYADPIISLRRDYNASLSLSPRSFLNEKNLNDFNNSMIAMKPRFMENIENVSYIDTNNLSGSYTAVEVASDIMPVIRTRYLDSFKSQL